MNMRKKIYLGNEIEVKTKDGQSFRGIFVNNEKGYLSAVAGLGIILTFPMDSILNIVKI